MTPITYSLVTEVGDWTHVVEASTLGLSPGQWPDQLEVSPDFGNGQSLTRQGFESMNGELQSVIYRQALGILRVRVFND